MTKLLQLFSFAAAVAVATFLLTSTSSQAGEEAAADQQAAQPRYRTMYRGDIDILGGTKVKPRLDIEALQAGLNKLAEDGWELVAVEGGSSTGGKDVKISYAPVYIFRSIDR